MPLLRVEEVQIVLLEMQPPIVASSRTLSEMALRRAAAVVRSIASSLDIPLFVSTVPLGSGGPVVIDELGLVNPHVRSSISIFDDEQARKQLAANGRKILALGGVSVEIAILHAALGALRAHYDVYLLTDCCGGLSDRTEAAAWRQMEAAGAVVSNVSSFFTSLVEDMSSDHGQVVMRAMAELWSWNIGDG